jgi:hypothetical protein
MPALGKGILIRIFMKRSGNTAILVLLDNSDSLATKAILFSIVFSLNLLPDGLFGDMAYTRIVRSSTP